MRPRSVAAVAALERRQQEESARSGLNRDPSTDPAELREIAQRQLIAERLETVSGTAPDEFTAAAISLVGDPGYEQAVDARVRALSDFYAGIDGDIWSRYERPDHRKRLSELVVKVERAALALGYQIQQRPVVGTLQTGDINAQAEPGPPNEGHLVVFDSGMFRFTSLAANIVVQAIDLHFSDEGGSLLFNTPEAFGEHIATHPGVIIQFADLVFSQAVLKTCLLSGIYPLPARYQALANEFTDYIQTFVLAHESGHLVLGHVDLPSARRSSMQPHELEFDADRVGLAIAAAAIGARYWAFVAGAIFMMAVEVISRASATFINGNDEVAASATHPPPSARLERLATLLQDGVDPRMVVHMGRMVDTIAEALDRLWRFCRPAFERAHREKYPPADFFPRDELEQRAALQAFMATGLSTDPGQQLS